LHVESVAWVSERKDVLSTLLFLLTLFSYARYVELKSLHTPRSTLLYALTLLFFALGLMSKPMLVTLPFVLLLLDFWPLRRVMDGKWRVGMARLACEKVPFFILSVASCVVTFLAQKHGGAVSTSISLGARMSNALISYARYLGKFCWPEKLSVLYPHPGHWPA